jgi:hypothetical protein
MPTIYRVMRPDGNRPMVGESATTLGVRIPRDIQPDDAGDVHLDSQGMSVAPSLRKLPFHLVPRRLNHLRKHARGNNNCRVWRFGNGPFSDGNVAEKLVLRVTSATHGVVAPSKTMTLSEYVDALSGSRDAWSIDEA